MGLFVWDKYDYYLYPPAALLRSVFLTENMTAANDAEQLNTVLADTICRRYTAHRLRRKMKIR